jgi:hypothetical protein
MRSEVTIPTLETMTMMTMTMLDREAAAASDAG